MTLALIAFPGLNPRYPALFGLNSPYLIWTPSKAVSLK